MQQAENTAADQRRKQSKGRCLKKQKEESEVQRPGFLKTEILRIEILKQGFTSDKARKGEETYEEKITFTRL